MVFSILLLEEETTKDKDKKKHKKVMLGSIMGSTQLPLSF